MRTKCGTASPPRARVVAQELLEVVDLLVDGVARRSGRCPPPPSDAVSASTTAAIAISTASVARIVPSRRARRALLLRLRVGLAASGRGAGGGGHRRRPGAQRLRGRGHVAQGAGGVGVDGGQAARGVGHLAADAGVQRPRHLERRAVAGLGLAGQADADRAVELGRHLGAVDRDRLDGVLLLLERQLGERRVLVRQPARRGTGRRTRRASRCPRRAPPPGRGPARARGRRRCRAPSRPG